MMGHTGLRLAVAIALEDDAEVLNAYLGQDVLPFDRQLLVGQGPGSIARVFAAEGIRVPARASTPSAVVIDGEDRLVGQVGGTGGPARVERRLRQLGFAPD